MAREFIYHMRGLSKTYPGNRKVLENINLSFYPDAKIGVLGVNGSGKSTLLRIMAGIDKEWSGDGLGRGRARASATCRRSRSSIRERPCARTSWRASRPQQAMLDRYNELAMNYSDETADEMTALQDEIEAKGLWDLDSKVEQAMDALGCPPDDWPVDRLSGGEKRRVALCQLLLAQPELLLLDEPTNHLDAETVGLARRPSARLPGRDPDRHPRPLLPRQRHRLDPRARPRPRHPLRGQLLLLARAEAEAPRPGRPRGGGAPAHHRARARMGARLAEGAPGEVEGPHPALRRSRREGRREGPDARPRSSSRSPSGSART